MNRTDRADGDDFVSANYRTYVQDVVPACGDDALDLLREALAWQVSDTARAHDEILFLGRLADRGLVLAPRDRPAASGG